MGNTGSAVVQCVLSVGLVVAGAAVAAASFGGASVLANGLISAGVSGATTTITNAAQGRPTSWKEWAESSTFGGVAGIVGGAMCAGAGGVASSMEKGFAEGVLWQAVPLKEVCNTAGSMASSVTWNAIANVWSGRRPLEGADVALAVGAAGVFAGIGAASFGLLKRSSVSRLAHPLGRHHRELNGRFNGAKVKDSCRFYELETDNHAREDAHVAVATKTNVQMLVTSPDLSSPVVDRQLKVNRMKTAYTNVAPPPSQTTAMKNWMNSLSAVQNGGNVVRNVRAGDRMSRRQVARNVLVQQRHNREEEREYLVGA